MIKIDDNTIGSLRPTQSDGLNGGSYRARWYGNSAQTFTPNASIQRSVCLSDADHDQPEWSLTGDHAVTVSVNGTGRVGLTVAGGAGTIVFEEHSTSALRLSRPSAH